MISTRSKTSRDKRERSWWTLALWVGAGAVVAAGGLAWGLRPKDALQTAVDRVLRAPLTIWRAPPLTFDGYSDRDSTGGMGLILRSGTNCVPYLCRELRRRDTAFTRFWLARWRALPEWLTRALPEPVPIRARRLRAITLLQCLGQGALRPATGTLIEALSDPTPEVAAAAAAALAPVMSESPRAREAFVDYFRRTRGGEYLGAEIWSADFWRQIPELVPSLVRQLEHRALAADAARALEMCGPRAAGAVPALIEVAAEGVAGNGENPGCESGEGGSEILVEARCNALPALARTGARTDPVLRAFFGAWTDPSHPLVRYNGGAALAACGAAAAPLVPGMVATLDDEDGFTLVRKIHSLGELGPVARAALPRLTAYEAGQVPLGRGRTFRGASADDVRFAATEAICAISTAEAGSRVERLASALGEREEAARCLGGLKELAPRILPLMRDRLRDPDRVAGCRAAFVILRLKPGDGEAARLLRLECGGRDLMRRLGAARLLCEATHDVPHTLPVFLEMLSRPELRFEAEEGIRLCGREARPAAPELLRLLWHPHGEIRRAAGDLLREIAPDTLPAINEQVL